MLAVTKSGNWSDSDSGGTSNRNRPDVRPCLHLTGNYLVARWRSGQGVELATGGRGFNPSRYTVECNFGQVVRTHCPVPLVLQPYGAIYISLNLKNSACEWQKFLSAQTKQASSLVNFRVHYKIVGLYFVTFGRSDKIGERSPEVESSLQLRRPNFAPS